MVQSWAYGEAKQAAGGWRVRRLVFERQGQPAAICQLLDKSLARIRWASRLNRGPLFLNAAAPGDDVVTDVYRALRRRWQYLRGGVLVLAPALEANLENYRMMREIGFRDRRVRGWLSAYLDLRQDEEQLRKNLAPNWRNHLKKAESADLTLRTSHSPEDVDWIVDRHVAHMREKGFSGPAPALLRTLYRAAPDDFVVFQARLEEEPVGGMVVYRFGDAAEYYIGWSGPAGRKANVGNLLCWNAALEMRRRGCRRFDLGGYSSNDRYGHFKQGTRGVQYQLLNEWLAF